MSKELLAKIAIIGGLVCLPGILGYLFLKNNKNSYGTASEFQSSTNQSVERTVSEPQISTDRSLETNRPLDWKNEFGDTNWQESIREVCGEDFQLLIHGTSSSFLPNSCQDSFRPGISQRHITDQEKNLLRFISKVVGKVAPAGYVLGGIYGDSRDVWVEDLNNDGKMDMVIFLTPAAEMTPEKRYSVDKDVSHNILLIVTPVNSSGESKILVEISGKDLEQIAPPSYATFHVEKIIDFDHDGKKELLIPSYGNQPASSIFKVDYEKGIIMQLHYRDQKSKMWPVYLGYGSDAGGRGVSNFFLKDVDHDGIDEFLSIDREGSGGVGNWVYKITAFNVYKWNGSFFDFSKSLSEQLKSSFDPSGVPWVNY